MGNAEALLCKGGVSTELETLEGLWDFFFFCFKGKLLLVFM